MPGLTAYQKFLQVALKYGFSLWGTPKTGQTVSFRTGDDGYYIKGYPKAGDRFVDNGDGTITDNATGLMWVKDPSQLGGVWGTPGTPSKITWNIIIDTCFSLDYAGHNDWRLPNIKELFGITDCERSDVHINPIFSNAVADYYWSSTVNGSNTTYKLTVRLGVPFVMQIHFAGVAYGRPVRLGVPA